jgi:16S rRNA (guanine1207-N2)-methyltransferase
MMDKMATHPYELVKQFPGKLADELVEIISKPGLADWDKLLPSSELLAVYPRLLPSDQVLLMGCHHGALAVFIARHLPVGQLSITDNNSIALAMTRKTLAANNISNVNLYPDCNLPGIERKKYNAVFIQIPKGRKLCRRWLLQTYQVLIPGGNVYIAGSKHTGIQSSIKDAMELFGNGRIMAYKKGNRLSHLVKRLEESSLPDWVHSPGITPGTWVEFSVSISDHCYQIRSLPGVFSFDHLDEGTKILLSTVNIHAGCKVLDVGCGFGMVGVFAATHGASWVDLIDNDLLAIASCKETLAINRISNTSVFTSDLLDHVYANKYDLILSNPPFHTGHAVDYQIAEAIIRQSFQALNPGGQLCIVANRFIPYDRLINGIFGNVLCLAESGRFHVLSGIKSG